MIMNGKVEITFFFSQIQVGLFSKSKGKYIYVDGLGSELNLTHLAITQPAITHGIDHLQT